MFPSNSFRMNTCKSVSKQRTLTTFRMNTCEKPGEGSERGFAQAQSIRNHRHGAEAHGRARNHGTQQPMEEWIEGAGRNRDSQRVVKKSKSKVLADVPDRGAAQPPSAHNPAQVPFHQ